MPITDAIVRYGAGGAVPGSLEPSLTRANWRGTGPLADVFRRAFVNTN
jgi:hypothetical protein